MDSRTITLIASIAIIGIVAIGAGYAYTAMSINDGNNATAQYVTLTQNSYTFTTNPVDEFNTLTDSTHYQTTGTQNVAGFKVTTPMNVSDYKLANLGTVTLTATTTGFTDQPDLVLNIENAYTQNFVSGTALTYYLVDSSNAIVGKLVSGQWKAANGTDPFSVEFPEIQNNAASIALTLAYGYADTSATWNPLSESAGYVLEVPANMSAQSPGRIVFSANEAPAQP